MEKFIKEFKKDIIFYGMGSYVSNEKETHTDNAYMQENLICEQGKIAYGLRKISIDGVISSAAAVLSSDVKAFLRLPAKEIESLINAAIFYNEVIEDEV